MKRGRDKGGIGKRGGLTVGWWEGKGRDRARKRLRFKSGKRDGLRGKRGRVKVKKGKGGRKTDEF